MIEKKWMLLQLFAEGGSSGEGEGASTGEMNDAAAGHQRLRELGVPESRIRKDKAYRLPMRKTQGPATQEKPAEGSEQVAPASPTEGKRMTWDEIMADPEYNKSMQETMRSRLKKSSQELEAHGKMSEAYKTLARYYGLDADNIDFDALASKVQGDDGLVESRAMQNGVDPTIQRKLDEYEALKSQQKLTSQQQAQQQMIDAHMANLRQQAEKMKTLFPNFNLEKELENNEFKRLVGPGVRVPVETAYKLIHQDEIFASTIQAAQQKATQAMSNAIQAGAQRPTENGSSSQSPSVTSIDWRQASPEQRAAQRKAIRDADARGERIYPGR